MEVRPPKPREVIAIYPGTFDLLTHGHLDIIRRAAVMFGRLIVAVARNDKKAPFFTPEERVEMLREAVQDLPTVESEVFAPCPISSSSSKWRS
jgi:pantetheine-phosphate adenylyltransferase